MSSPTKLFKDCRCSGVILAEKPYDDGQNLDGFEEWRTHVQDGVVDVQDLAT